MMEGADLNTFAELPEHEFVEEISFEISS